MTSWYILSVCLATFLRTALCAPEADLVRDLPGVKWKPDFKHYSGYLKASSTKHLHYWFVESSAEPSKDPVVLWMNGGPGCSSMEGMLNENGPFKIEADGVTVSKREFSWNRIANVIFLEAPAGVGYSYDDDSHYATSDIEVAEHNLNALKDFFEKFPEYKKNDFYVSGESYGGIYIPTLVDNISNSSSINLKGFLVGNGLSDDRMDQNSIIYFAYYHGLIGGDQFRSLFDACCHGNATTTCDFYTASKQSHRCESAVYKIQILVWSSGLNVYNLYSECAGKVQNPMLHFNERKGEYETYKYVLPYFGKPAFQNLDNTMGHPLLFGKRKVNSGIPCTDDFAIKKYMNTPAVKKALHIANIWGMEWEMCSDTVASQYYRNFKTMTPQYRRALSKKLRILLYNGDVDMACNFLGDEWFVDSLQDGQPQPRVMWYYKEADGTKQVAGFYKRYQHISFVTVKGSGHMVPQDKPRQAYKMFESFLLGKPL